MTQRQYLACKLLHGALVANAPKDTWNLALNSIRLVQETGTWYVVIGGEIAPYAVFTNEPWSRGKNPNEHWIEKTIEQCLPMIKQIMAGAISEAEINEWQTNNHYKRLTETYHEHITKKIKELSKI